MSDVTTSGDVVVTRSEEQLHVSTRAVPVARAVLRRRVVTEERTITVLVRHEEAVLEIVPFDGSVRADEGREAAHRADPQFTLHREEVVVTTRLVPVERVRLDVRTITELRVVTDEVRSERISFDDGTGGTDPAVSHTT